MYAERNQEHWRKRNDCAPMTRHASREKGHGSTIGKKKQLSTAKQPAKGVRFVEI